MPEEEASAGSSWLNKAPSWLWVVSFVIIAAVPLLLFQLPKSEKINYLLVLLIGATVGATELMSRYRDAPFRPLLSAPGFFYIVLNGGAALVAYYLIGVIAEPLSQDPNKAAIYRVLLGGLGAMAFFRSGLFTLRIGNSDVPVGPNLVLQILLQALDRTYDRIRAAPRSDAASQIMAGVDFALAKEALPSFCFNLMQNVAQTERIAVGAEVKTIGESETMSPEAKTLNLGLTLLNVVGEKTLRSAVTALGGSIRGAKGLKVEILAALIRLDAPEVVERLPLVVGTMSAPQSGMIKQTELDRIAALLVSDQSKAIIMTYVLVRHYGEGMVEAALNAMLFSIPSPPPPTPAAPPPSPAPAGVRGFLGKIRRKRGPAAAAGSKPPSKRK